MRVLRCLAVIAVLCGFAGLANASPVDFHMSVLDPPPPLNPSYPTYPIDSISFLVSFTPCVAGELPIATPPSPNGCFAGHNISGLDWNSMELVFADNAVLASQPANCELAVSNNAFANPDCSLSDGSYFLDFSEGEGIPNGAFFYIVEDGVDPAGFGVGTATVTATVPTPEPAPVLLLSTGIILFGLWFYGERRRMISSSLLS